MKVRIALTTIATGFLLFHTGAAGAQTTGKTAPNTGQLAETKSTNSKVDSAHEKPANNKPADSKKTTDSKKASDSEKTAHSKASGTEKAHAMVVPSPELMLIMVRSAIIALDQANKTNNYSVLHALGGPSLKSTPTENLAAQFEPLRKAQINMQAVLLQTPQLVEAPTISDKKLLVLKGYLPSRPLQLRFNINYEMVDCSPSAPIGQFDLIA